jgi:Xaa-Pro aminopeptidase
VSGHAPDIAAIQEELRAVSLDGWLFYDFLQRDPIAYRVLGVTGKMVKRRWFYLIPARGTPRKLLHRIELQALDALPGKKLLYASQQEFDRGVTKLLRGMKTVAMQYSPRNIIPYVSTVDAGTIELLRSLGIKVAGSAELVQKFDACWTPEQLQTHLEAGRIIDRITHDSFGYAADQVRRGCELCEYGLQQWMAEKFRLHGILADAPPTVAVGRNSGNPHYVPPATGSAPIRMGDILLLDVWGKLPVRGSVYYDITWMGYLGSRVPEKYSRLFSIVREARDCAVTWVREGVASGREMLGWEVDRVAREVIRKAGYAKSFIHRTGHSIGEEVHGTGTNIDGLETKDVRRIIAHTCFSIEPGIYLKDFGVRSEVDVFVDRRDAKVTGALQTEILALLA